MRINPIIFMSLSIVMIFYFFNRNYSLLAGIYSLFISMSSFMVWFYWAEARPYALWVFLTTCQSLILLSLINEESFNARLWRLLTFVHILFCFTIIFGIIQIAATTVLLWLFYERRWKKYIGLFLLPLVVSVLYYITSPTFFFQFKATLILSTL